jgi:photosystem II stability/assembly factor-like uncharacterized protein
MSPSWRLMQAATTSNLGGVHVVDREIVWAVGGFDRPSDLEPQTPGVVVRTVDRGHSWEDVTPPGGEQMIFHDVKAFGRNLAFVLALGSGEDSKIYRTDDGGANWRVVFVNDDPDAFYDGIAFFGRDPDHGIAFSDPVGGKFPILTSDDGGHHWRVAPTGGMPAALDGEDGRATGSCLVTQGPDHAWFGTQPDGPNARVFRTDDHGQTWRVATTPIPAKSSDNTEFGIASLAFRDTRHGLALGGRSPRTPTTPSVVAETTDGGRTWTQVGPPAGFRTSLTFAGDITVTVGFTGSDFSTDEGHTWQHFDDTDLRGVHCHTGEIQHGTGHRLVSCWAVGENGVAAELMR